MSNERVIGQEIVEIRRMTRKELESEGWNDDNFRTNTALVLKNGVVLYASRDAEGNGSGAIFGVDKEVEFSLVPS